MKKDKVTYIMIFGLFAVYIILIIVAFFNLDNYSSVSASALDNITIVLDAGHGGEDGGAVANGIIEKDINLSITNKLCALFKTAGFNVKFTRTNDAMLNSEGSTLRERKLSDMKNRLSMFNSSEKNVVISIHQNKFTQEQYSGTQIFYSPNNENSAKLSEAIKENIVSLIQPQNKRETKKADNNIYLLYNANVPAVIVECGFISNAQEALKLKDNDYQNKIAFAVFSGFLEYYNE
ncbi:MAG: N-acetylmuramoyl-L-alanine amidase [Ruminococcus sp.]|nr:N-acetylmuramoyl-L-alanine amidase [Ruminococcus sp.]